MIREVHVKTIEQADDTDLRSLSVNVGHNQIITPVKITEPKNFYRETVFPKPLSSLTEIYLKFNRSSLEKMGADPKYSKQKNQELSSLSGNGNETPSISIISFNDNQQENPYPNDREIEQLINIAYSFSDITPIPSIPNVARKITIDSFGNFINYLQKAIDTLEIRNKKSAIGYIPANIPPIFFQELVDFYLDNGINSYYIDFDGTMITSHITSLDGIKRQIKKRGYEESSFLHYVNVSYGKAINDVGVVSARDLLGFGFGMDSLGGIHQGPRRSSEFYEKLKEMKNIQSNSVRLLNREDYGYYKINIHEHPLSVPYPQDAIIPYQDIKNANTSRVSRSLKIVNNQKQCEEACLLRTIIKETGDSSMKYFKSKSNLSDGDLKKLEKSHIS